MKTDTIMAAAEAVAPQEEETRVKPLMQVRGVTVRFGGITALDGVTFDVNEGEICGLIGPNGAGKTTLFNCISRVYDCNEGDILIDGESLTAKRRHEIAATGIGRTFQNLALFKTLSVCQNIMLGGHSNVKGGFLAGALHSARMRADEKHLSERADMLITYLGLEAVAEAPVSDLTFATLKRVEMARALACEPKILLLDEPAGGLNHHEVDHLRQLITDVRDTLNTTVLLVEHHLNLVMDVSDRVVAVDFGRVIADGSPEEVRNHPDVIRAYLGE